METVFLLVGSRLSRIVLCAQPPSLFGNRSHLKTASGSALDNPQAAVDLVTVFEQKADQFIAYSKLYKPGRMKGTRDAVVHLNYIMIYALNSDTIKIFYASCIVPRNGQE